MLFAEVFYTTTIFSILAPHLKLEAIVLLELFGIIKSYLETHAPTMG